MKYLIPLLFISTLAYSEEIPNPPAAPKTVTLTQQELQEYVTVAIQNYLLQQTLQKSQFIIHKVEDAFK